MKYLITLPALLFTLSASAQTYTAFKLDTDKPAPGHEIHFVYTGAFSRKIDPRLTMYYDVNNHLRWKTLSAKYNGTCTTGSLIIPDSTAGIEIKARNNRDTTESFIFNIVQTGKPGKTASAQQKQPHDITEETLAAFNRESADLLKNKIPAGNFLTDLTGLEIKYPKLVAEGKFDRIYAQLARLSFQQGDIKNAEHYVAEIRFKYIQKEYYVNGARALLKNSSSNLQLAETYVQRAIALAKFEPMPYYVFDQKEWAKRLEGDIANYLAISAQIQYKLGNVQQAITRLASALQKAGSNTDIEGLYLQYLLSAGESKIAMNAAEKYVEQDEITDQIKTLLKEAYTKENNGPDGYDDYFRALMKKAELQYVLPEYGKLNVPAINFSLEDIHGKTVSLLDFSGKPVVLYFFSPDKYGNAQHAAFNDYFSKVVKAHSGSNVTFLAIDEATVSETDEASGRPLRIQKINDFLIKNNLGFEVLMDTHHRDPGNTGFSFYFTADTYSADSGCQFYVIDKNRIVRYKSFPYTPMPVERFEHELNAALRLIE